MELLVPLYLIQVLSNILGSVGSGFFKSLKVFQIIYRNCYKSFENAECNINDVILVLLLLILNIFVKPFSSVSFFDFEQVNG